MFALKTHALYCPRPVSSPLQSTEGQLKKGGLQGSERTRILSEEEGVLVKGVKNGIKSCEEEEKKRGEKQKSGGQLYTAAPHSRLH